MITPTLFSLVAICELLNVSALTVPSRVYSEYEIEPTWSTTWTNKPSKTPGWTTTWTSARPARTKSWSRTWDNTAPTEIAEDHPGGLHTFWTSSWTSSWTSAPEPSIWNANSRHSWAYSPAPLSDSPVAWTSSWSYHTESTTSWTTSSSAAAPTSGDVGSDMEVGPNPQPELACSYSTKPTSWTTTNQPTSWYVSYPPTPGPTYEYRS
ncbi:hypothetical protein K493DRAFT_298863 [Basidiobolus meristosporus CBS 931.73]|uniref:Uncharacterized protein n=1 Tax=Basidiobolus meristosporus CBS 931.73 TaxID=1314790 RepID=A0A1Y1YRQ6_9FUNG|nr:hypothetical protein K493DRAFT_298863 [Basidiobolus meristosporus CBS 931.73]|eukprot:ORY00504.1 hypothetical protein K493DRAFT_298863 [Basidiobolus meristosporus CBS 931.73]